MSACEEVFQLWAAKVESRLCKFGIDEAEAERGGALFVRLMLGATMAARVSRSVVPIDKGMNDFESMIVAAG